MEEMLTSSHAGIDAVLDDVAKEGCSSLLDEVFMDLEVKFYFLLRAPFELNIVLEEYLC